MDRIKLRFIVLLFSIFGGIILFSYCLNRLKNYNVDESNSGINTISIINRSSNNKEINLIVENQSTDLFGGILKTIKYSDSKYKCLWLGASQLHSINRYKKGEKLAFCEADILNKKDGISHFQFSSPNANFHDILSMFLAVVKKGVQPDLLIIPLVYDDLREYPIQDRLLVGVNELDINRYCRSSKRHFIKQMDLLKAQSFNNSIQKNVIDNTPQVILEEKIIKSIGSACPDFNKRSNLYNYYHSMLYISSVKLFGSLYGMAVQPSKDAVRYPLVSDTLESWNLLALDDIVSLANKNNIKILFYRQPIRPTKGVFYHELEGYNNHYLHLVNKYEKDNNVLFVDLQNIVSQNNWGKTNLNQPDVFHFTAYGHKVLGDTIAKLSKSILLRK